MTENLDDSIRSASADIIASAPRVGSAPAGHGGHSERPRTGRRASVVAAVALGVGMVGALIVLAGRGDSVTDRSTEPTTDTDHTASASVPTIDLTSVPTSLPTPPSLRARCDKMEFGVSDGYPAIADLAPVEGRALEALDFAEQTGAPSDYNRSLFDWRVAAQSDEMYRLLGIPASSTAETFASATVMIGPGGFATAAPGMRALGYCAMTLESEGWSRADLTLDPTQPPDSGSTSVRVQAVETACASGRTPTIDDVDAVVDEDASTIRIRVLVRTPPGDQTCTDNPPLELELRLDEPVGTRAIVDASIVPAQPL